jgi:spore coat protein CotH
MKKITLRLILSLSIIFTSFNVAKAQSLPHYEITLNQVYLDSMNAHPHDETYFPAVFKVNGTDYTVQARYKGSSTLDFPKKSWAIKFEDTNNPFQVTRINLHADYNDPSAMRNFLILKLCAKLRLPAPTIQHVTYTVNGNNWGVYTQTEQIDNFFLARNGRQTLSIYKGNDHGANLAPLVNDNLYNSVWQIEGGGDISFNELRVLFNKFLYLPKSEFDSQLDSFFDTDKALDLYSVLFTFVEFDNFTKNTWINKNSNTLKYELLPWDNEGSFGNGALGDFDSTTVHYNFDEYQMPEYALVIQRMLENPVYKASFQQKVNKILTSGMPFLDSLINATYSNIKQDVYLDPNKKATNAQFDAAPSQLKWFMNQRSAFLQSNILPERNTLTLISCKNPLPSTNNPLMTIRVKSPVAQSVRLVFADSVDYVNIGQNNKLRTVVLYDDGLHNDSIAGDLIYGNTIDSRNFSSKWAQFTMLGGGQNYPANAILYTKYVRTKAFALNKGNSKDSVAYKLKMDKAFAYGNNRFIRITNSSADTLDVSYCHIRTNKATDDFMFPENSLILPHDTAYVCASPEMGKNFFAGKHIFANLYYSFALGDSLHFLSPLLTPILNIKANSIENLNTATHQIVFNEINYSSATTHNTKDWVEIYNAGTSAVDMSGWIYRDNDNSHAFVIKNGFSLAACDYMVIGEDTTAIKTYNPGIKNLFGNQSFGLSSSGENVRLFDNIGNLVDSVEFTSTAPWPTTAKATGATLELISPTLDNSLVSSWFVKTGSFGTPGKVNNTAPTSIDIAEIHHNKPYPNPSNGHIYYDVQVPNTEFELYTLEGNLVVKTISQSVGNAQAIFNAQAAPKGVYMMRINEDGIYSMHKLIVW